MNQMSERLYKAVAINGRQVEYWYFNVRPDHGLVWHLNVKFGKDFWYNLYNSNRGTIWLQYNYNQPSSATNTIRKVIPNKHLLALNVRGQPCFVWTMSVSSRFIFRPPSSSAPLKRRRNFYWWLIEPRWTLSGFDGGGRKREKKKDKKGKGGKNSMAGSSG
jgi:hypothetical protein